VTSFLEPILSASEVEALLQANVGHERGRRSTALRLEAESVDLIASDRFVRLLLPTLRVGYARMTTSLRRIFTSVLRQKVEVTEAEPELLSGRGLGSAARNAGALVVVAMATEGQPLAHGVIALDPALTFAIIERMFGGGGEPRPPSERPLTTLEAHMLARAVAPVVEAIERDQDPRGHMRLRVRGIEGRLELVPGLNPDVTVIHVPFTLAMADRLASLSLAFPAQVFEGLRPTVYGGPLESEVPGGIQRTIGAVPVGVSVELGRAFVPLRELLALQVGQVIKLDRPRAEALPVRVEGVVKFHGAPVHQDGAIAVEIVRRS
jgi:flagellar motor switch protein FliM